MIPRLYLYAALAIAMASIAAVGVHLVKKANRAEAAEEALKIERENTRIANESASRYAARLQVARGPRSPPPQLLCKLPRVPPTASRTVDSSIPDDGGVPEETDVGPRLDVSYSACEENLIKLEELQRFVRESR